MSFKDFFKSKFSDDPLVAADQRKLAAVGLKPESPFQKLMSSLATGAGGIAAASESFAGNPEMAEQYRKSSAPDKNSSKSIFQQILLKKLMSDPKDNSTNQMKNYMYYMQGLAKGQQPVGFMEFLKSGGGGGGMGNIMLQLGLGDTLKGMIGNSFGGIPTAPNSPKPGDKPAWKFNRATGKPEPI